MHLVKNNPLGLLIAVLGCSIILFGCNTNPTSNDSHMDIINDLVDLEDGQMNPAYSSAMDVILKDDYPISNLVESFSDRRKSQPIASVSNHQNYTVGDLCYYLFLIRLGIKYLPEKIGSVDLSPIPDSVSTKALAEKWWQNHSHNLVSAKVSLIEEQINELRESPNFGSGRFLEMKEQQLASLKNQE